MQNAYKQKQNESNEKDYKILVRVYNGGNNNAYDYSFYGRFYVSWQEEKERIQYVGVVSLYSFDKQGRTIGQLINIERLMKIANLAIAMVLAIPMFILAVPFYMCNKIRGKV